MRYKLLLIILFISPYLFGDVLTQESILSKIESLRHSTATNDESAMLDAQWCAFYCHIYNEYFNPDDIYPSYFDIDEIYYQKSPDSQKVVEIQKEIQDLIRKINKKHDNDPTWRDIMYKQKQKMLYQMSDIIRALPADIKEDMPPYKEDIAPIKIEESLARLYLLTGDEYLKQNKLEDARGQYKEIISYAPQSPLLKQAVGKLVSTYEGDSQGMTALKTWSDGIIDPRIQAKVKYELISCLYDKNQYDKALQELDDFLKLNLDDDMMFDAKFLYAMCYSQKGDIEKAVSLWNSLKSYTPKADKAQFTIGWAYISSSQYESAKKELEKFIQEYPNSDYIPEAKKLIKKVEKLLEKK